MKDKQIKEMGKIIAKADDTCRAEKITQALYRAGYRKQTEWINALDEMPKEGERVLVKLESVGYNGVEHTLIDTDKRMRGRWVRWRSYVTHWMPLPEIPKGEQK